MFCMGTRVQNSSFSIVAPPVIRKDTCRWIRSMNTAPWPVLVNPPGVQPPRSVVGRPIAMVLTHNPAAMEAIKTANYDVVSHGGR
ncbi:MAG: hypothetical protein GPOALKHO_001006 [Sodalis sp.]|nr:MAG: hypothetical protein GPOALKHO_001006 [Sodalis sp.]